MNEEVLKINEKWNLYLQRNQDGTVRPRIAREDKRFFGIEMKQLPGYDSEIPTVVQESGKNPSGQIAVNYMIKKGEIKVLVRTGNGFFGEVLELNSSSLSKGETVPSCSDKYIQLDPQRIQGRNQVLTQKVDENSIGNNSRFMGLDEYAELSEDGRGLAALVKVGFFVPKHGIF
jgi:hypothetical protein